MRIDVTALLKTLDGKNTLQGLDVDVKPRPRESQLDYSTRASVDLTFRKTAVEMLSGQGEGDSGELKLKKFVLAERIQLQDTVTLTNEDVRLLQDAVDAHANVIIIGRMTEILDPEGIKKARLVPEDDEDKDEKDDKKSDKKDKTKSPDAKKVLDE